MSLRAEGKADLLGECGVGSGLSNYSENFVSEVSIFLEAIPAGPPEAAWFNAGEART